MNLIKCAAIQFNDGNIYDGYDHGDCWNTAVYEGQNLAEKPVIEGFLDTAGEFLTRSEAYSRAEKTGQLRAGFENYSMLNSFMVMLEHEFIETKEGQ